ncbi:uncharacterized protein C2845_PM17G04180 [Panicum miliaceum]|uniref:Uncharacterized protein n=1 Tax=Panicum miliaceum TaxID=4540 RepID=A0A3L6Q2Z4_PANMI|nr:uncharacterized protein C2845_PM17G04180 [Panicum miliaceum]
MKAYDNDNLVPLTGLADDKNTAAYLTQVTEDNKTLRHLTKASEENNNVSHLTELTGCKKNTVGRLAELLDATNNITYRTIAAEILESLCIQCDLDKQVMKETLLPKIIVEIPSSKSDQPESQISEGKEKKKRARRSPTFRKENNQENRRNYEAGNNEKNQNYSAPRKDKENQQNFALRTDKKSQGNYAPEACHDKKVPSDQQNGEQSATKELQEAFLSLALVMCDKLISADVAVQEKALGGESFVLKLKTIIDDNCQSTAGSMRIVKLSGHIAASMMQSQQYAEHFRNKEFVQSLSKASKIMCSLESCMMFVGSDFGLKKTVRPLLSEVVSELEQKALESV